MARTLFSCPTTQTDQRIVLLDEMNNRYCYGSRLGCSQLGGWTTFQREVGAIYARTLLRGMYIDPKTETTHRLPLEPHWALERTLLATIDLFEGGHGMLYDKDPIISDTTRKALGREIIKVVRTTTYPEQDSIERGLRHVLIPGDAVASRLTSVKGTWMNKNNPRAYDPGDTKRIIEELIPLITERFD